jgi:formate dehydrogenase major subunit
MAVAKGNLRKAYDLITSSSPLQFICGYACNHPCESVCIRGNIDEAIRIREIKRFVLEYGKENGWTPQLNMVKKNGHKIAVIGAGPAGLSAAFYLQLAGYEVTVFEKEVESGGLLRYGIPTYRLPKEILDYETDLIKLLGIHIEYTCEYPKDITISQLKREGFGAIIMAIGAQKSIPLNIPGEDSSGYKSALEFLGNIQKGNPISIGDKVVVIGGGFSAVDAARTCVRLGAQEVYIAYRRTKDEMPASPEEIKEAEEEGVKIMYLVSPKEIILEVGKITGIRLVNYVLGETDDSNRRRPLEIEGTEFTLKVDTVISALGQYIEPMSDQEFSEISNEGSIKVNPGTFKTSLENVYAIGDAALGAGDIITAIASGKQAAAAIDQQLSGPKAIIHPIAELNSIERNYVLESKGNSKRILSVRNYIKKVQDRIKNYDLYTRSFTEEEAITEASRCLNCGCGDGCMLCADICNSFAITNEYGKPAINKEECVGCGICVWRCPNDNLEMIETQ